MTFRTRLLLVSSMSIAGAVALVTGAVSVFIRRSFDRMDEDRRNALIAQFQREVRSQGEQVARRVERAVTSEPMMRLAIEAGRPEPDLSSFLTEAQQQADIVGLDFFDVVRADGTVLSSAHWQARFGYRNNWLIQGRDFGARNAILTRIPTPEGEAVAMAVVRPSAASSGVYAMGGQRLDKAFLASLTAPGVRAILWLGPSEVYDAGGPLPDATKLAGVIARVNNEHKAASEVVQWTDDRTSREALLAMPLERAGVMLGVLIAGTSLREQVALERSILWTGLIAACSGILLGALMGWWTTERVTKPVAQLANSSRAIAAGDWTTRVPVAGNDEIGQLAASFNSMAAQLVEQRERTVQAERVAAWRELARRLAHELKNPLFPLQLTVENMQKARDHYPEQFEEVFKESTHTLLHELSNLKTIIGRFSDFAKMPKPHIEKVDVNAVVKQVMQLFSAQMKDGLRYEPALAAMPLYIGVDSEQLRRALNNLVLNAMDAMPEGGLLRIVTAKTGAGVRIEVSDTGQGLTDEECARLFTPYYTTKHHGTGLGLAIVQSVVSDHGGKIAVHSEPGKGATFVIDLPERSDA